MSSSPDINIEETRVNNEHPPSSYDGAKINKAKNDDKIKHEVAILMDELKLERADRVKHKVRKDNVYRGAPRTVWVFLNYDNVGPTGGTLDYDSDRNDFVRWVFLLVFFMLAFTVGIVVMFRYVKVLKDFLFTIFGLIIMVCALITLLAMHYVFFCSACSRKVPCNYICLVITTSCMGLIASFITYRYDTYIILIAIGVTAVVVLVCLCIACTSFDFTKYILLLIIAAVIVLVLSIVFSVTSLVFGIYYKPVHIVLIILSTLVSCFGLIIELQMILGGKTIELGEDDYALGAFMLYLSIIEIFFKILALTGLLSED